MKPTLTFGTLGLLSFLVVGCNSGKDSGKEKPPAVVVSRINGGGSSFIAPLMSKWAEAYGKVRNVEIDYLSLGSGEGVKKMTEKQTDFACSDAPLGDEQLRKISGEGEIIHIPLIMGGVVPIYNLKGVDTPLQFSGPVLASIYLGKITRWNEDPLIRLNPGIKLPDEKIVPIHRADSSGTTYIWSDFLCKVSPEWEKGPGLGTRLTWPVGMEASRNDGVAGQVSRTPGALGYVELLFARRNNIKYGLVQNREGSFIQASLQSVTAAAEGGLTEIPGDLRFSITNPPGKDSYPISGTTWAVFFARQPADKANAMADFFWWITHEGQGFAQDLDYAAMPQGLVERVEKKLEQFKNEAAKAPKASRAEL